MLILVFSSYIYSVNFKNTIIFGNSFTYQANQYLWEGALDIMERTEYYDRLHNNDIFYINYNIYPTIGINKSTAFGSALLLFQYYDDSIELDDDEKVTAINQELNNITEKKTDIDADIDTIFKAGIGLSISKK